MTVPSVHCLSGYYRPIHHGKNEVAGRIESLFCNEIASFVQDPLNFLWSDVLAGCLALIETNLPAWSDSDQVYPAIQHFQPEPSIVYCVASIFESQPN